MKVIVLSVKLKPASCKFDKGTVKYNEPFLWAHLTGAACDVNIYFFDIGIILCEPQSVASY